MTDQPKPRRWRRALLKLLLSVALTYGFAELGVRLMGIDDDLMLRSLYYQDSNAFVYEPVARGSLRYQPLPGTFHEQSETSGHAGDIDRAFSMTFDSHHARGPERSLERRPGLFRVLFVGGSTVFGHGVNDEETLTHQLELALQRELGDRPVEVWNFGRQAYVLWQSVELAEELVPELRPDLVLVHDYNQGRRPFLPESIQTWAAEEGRSPAAWLGARPDVVRGNWGVPDAFAPIHTTMMRFSALWRSVAAGIRLRGDRIASEWADQRSCDTYREARARWDQAGQAWAFVTIPNSTPRCLVEPEHFLDLAQPDREPNFYECHPPPDVLREWAEALARMIVERGFADAGGASE